MNAIVAKQWLRRNEEDFETESFLSQSSSFKTYKISHRHIHACHFKTVQKQKSTILVKATLTLETRIGYICTTHGYQRGICDGLQMKLA